MPIDNDWVPPMDFADHTVSIFDMKASLINKMPFSDVVIDETVSEYVPTEEDLFLTLSGGRYMQLIFEGVEQREREQQKLEEFHEWLEANDLTMPLGFEDGRDFRAMLSMR